MAFDPVAHQLKERVEVIYKEVTELIKQTILVGREYQNRRINFSIISDLFNELKDVMQNIDGGYELLEELTYTESGHKALLNILYYEVLNDLSKLYRGIVCRLVCKKLIEVLKDTVPEPHKD